MNLNDTVITLDRFVNAGLLKRTKEKDGNEFEYQETIIGKLIREKIEQNLPLSVEEKNILKRAYISEDNIRKMIKL